MRLKLAYSPCPNDTFAFHAMINGLIDTEGLEFKVELNDVEQLNKAAEQGTYDICKMSYHAFFLLASKYIMLRSGSALGYGNGPLFVSKKNSMAFNAKGEADIQTIVSKEVIVPGDKTTANLLLKIAYPQITRTIPVLFSEIERYLLGGKYLTGVLIHESRFTYKKRGMQLICDLGNKWHNISGLPVPLGGIAVSRDLAPETAQKISRVLKRSIEFAKNNPEPSAGYIKRHATEIEPQVIKQHIDMFVNNYTLDIGQEGEEAVKALYKKTLGIYPSLKPSEKLFI